MIFSYKSVLFAAILILLLTPMTSANAQTNGSSETQGMQVMGYVERIIVMPGKIRMKAKLDTGATTSSIDADIKEIYKKKNKSYVRFSITDIRGKHYELNERIVRWVRIKKKTNSDKLANQCEKREEEKENRESVENCFIRRPVVKMQFCIGNHLIEQEVNLAKRDHFLYPVLVGRNMLAGNILVDSSRTYTTKPKCSSLVSQER
jgi:hypothetical protein